MRLRLLLAALLLPLASAQAADVAAITTRPQPIYIEQGPTGQHLNFDFTVENLTAKKISIAGVELSVFDKKGALVLRRFLDGNGVRPSIETLTRRDIEAHRKLLVFNPFHTFDPQVALGQLRYEFTFSAEGQETEFKQTVSVTPQAYAPKTSLLLPVKNRLLVYDGHDFYAHHRRFDYVFEPLAQMGFTGNFMRYAYDFVPVSPQGDMYQGAADKNESYFGFGTPVVATGAGKIVALVSDQPDNHQFDQSLLPTRPMVLFGNYLVIDHGNGEFSVYGHLKQGSATVKIGDVVKPGQPLAQIGASGSAFFPHLHYELQTGPDTKAEGLPSYFTNFTRVLGSRLVAVKQGQVDTGDILDVK